MQDAYCIHFSFKPYLRYKQTLSEILLNAENFDAVIPLKSYPEKIFNTILKFLISDMQ